MLACEGKNSSSPTVIIFKIYWMLVTTINSVVATLSLAFYTAVCYVFYKDLLEYVLYEELETAVCYVFYKELEYVRRTFARKVAEMNDMAAVRGQQFGASNEIERFRMSHQRRCKV